MAAERDLPGSGAGPDFLVLAELDFALLERPDAPLTLEVVTKGPLAATSIVITANNTFDEISPIRPSPPPSIILDRR